MLVTLEVIFLTYHLQIIHHEFPSMQVDQSANWPTV